MRIIKYKIWKSILICDLRSKLEGINEIHENLKLMSLKN